MTCIHMQKEKKNSNELQEEIKNWYKYWFSLKSCKICTKIKVFKKVFMYLKYISTFLSI